MTLLVDTSVWSLALRRDAVASGPEVRQLQDALFGSDIIVTTGLVLQELLQGFTGPKAQAQIVERFAATHAAKHCPLRVWPSESRVKR